MFDKKREFTAREKAYFQVPIGSSAEHQVSILHETEVVLNSQMEWIMDHAGVFKAAFVGPLGNDLLFFQASKDEVSLQGLERFSKINFSIDDDGFFTIGGHWLGLKPGEIPCFLKGTFPLDWLQKANLYEYAHDHQVILVDDSQRDIRVDLYSNPKKEIIKKCIHISWNVFWIFKKYRIDICYENSPDRPINFNFDDEYMANVLLLDD